MEILIDDRREAAEKPEALLETIRKAVEAVLDMEDLGGPGEVSISLVGDDEIKSLNARYRHKDQVTDVLSFPQYEDREAIRGEGAYLVLGDIVIATGRMGDQALELGHSLEREATYLTVHGMYHLLGYDHEEAEERGLMRAKEKEVLKALKVFKE